MFKTVKKLITGLTFLLLTAIVVLVLFPLVPPFRGYYHTRTVLTGSMEPAIKQGSVIINKWVKDRELKEKDVVTFRNPKATTDIFITHRVVKIEPTSPLYRFQTKGDANQVPDSWNLTQANIEGKVILAIPLLGYLIEFFKTPVGFILLIALPLLIFIVRQIRDVFRLWQKRVIPRKSHKTLSVILVALAFLAARISFVTYAFFTSGQATITGVTLSTAASFGPSPQPGNVVINEVYYDVDDAHGTEGKNEWIELYNNTDQVVSLKNWSLTDNAGTKIINPQVLIAAHGYALIAHDASTWTKWDTHSAVTINLGGSQAWLNNDGDQLFLKDNLDNVIDFVAWENGHNNSYPAWPISAAEGHSISRKVAGVDTDTVDDWMDTHSGSSPPGPNPGTNPHNEDGSLVVPNESPKPADETIQSQEILNDEQSTESAEIVVLEESLSPSPTPTTEPTPTPSPTPETSPAPTPTAEPSPTPEPSTTPTPSPSPQPLPTASPEPSPSPSPEPTSTPAPTSEPTPTSTPTPSPTSELPTYGIA